MMGYCGGECIDDLAGPVGRAVVDGQDFQPIAVIVAFHQRLQDIRGNAFFVVHRNQHGDPRREESGQLIRVPRTAQRKAIQSETVVTRRIQSQYDDGDAHDHLGEQNQNCQEARLPHARRPATRVDKDKNTTM